MTPKRHVSEVSGKRHSRITLKLVLTRGPRLLVLSSFSLKLSPNCHHLFISCLHSCTHSRGGAIFLASRVVRSVRQLVSSYVVVSCNSVLVRRPVRALVGRLEECAYAIPRNCRPRLPTAYCRPTIVHRALRACSFLPPISIRGLLGRDRIPFANLRRRGMDLRSTFVNLAKGCWCMGWVRRV